MDKLIKGLFLAPLFFMAPKVFASDPIRYVQISTKTITKQSGSFNVGGATATTGKFNVVFSTTVTFGDGTSLTSATGFWNQIYPSTSAPQLLGVTDNSAAPNGYIGEQISTETATTTPYAASGHYGDLVSTSIAAGDYDCKWAIKQSANGATIIDCQYGITLTSGDSGTGMDFPKNSLSTGGATSGVDFSSSLAGIRESSGSTFTLYLKYFCDYSAAVPKATGIITCRRAR